MTAAHTMVPLHLSGNTTEEQNRRILEILSETAQEACLAAIEQLDLGRARSVLDAEYLLRSEVGTYLLEVIHRYASCDKYIDEQVPSNRDYPPSYRVRPIEAQVSELRKIFPGLGSCMEKIARLGLPVGAENWFAVPRWQTLAESYNEALARVLAEIAKRRKFQDRLGGKVGPTFLRQSERAKLAGGILADQQTGNDILILALQFGRHHRGCSARRARVRMESNEFALGAYEIACMLLVHPERLSSGDSLMIDCGGDEYSLRGDYTFDRVPLFDYDLSGIEFSIFYEDRSRNLWGTPSGFLYKLV